MTASSSYDSAPPVPPADGVWEQLAVGAYRQLFGSYGSQPPADLATFTSRGGWAPGGHGVVMQELRLAADGGPSSAR